LSFEYVRSDSLQKEDDMMCLKKKKNVKFTITIYNIQEIKKKIY